MWAVQIATLPVVWVPRRGGTWVMPSEAVLPDPQCRQQPELAAALLAAGVPLAMEVPETVAAAMLESTPGARAMHPALLRTHLQHAEGSLASLQGMKSSKCVMHCCFHRLIVVLSIGMQIHTACNIIPQFKG